MVWNNRGDVSAETLQKDEGQWRWAVRLVVRLFPLLRVLGTNRMRMSTKLQGPKEGGRAWGGEEGTILTLDRPCAEEQSMGRGRHFIVCPFEGEKTGSRKKRSEVPGSKCIHAADGGPGAGVNQEREDGLCEGGFAVKRRNREVRELGMRSLAGPPLKERLTSAVGSTCAEQ